MQMAMARIGPTMIATRTPVVSVTAPALAEEVDFGGDVPADEAPATVPLAAFPLAAFPLDLADSVTCCAIALVVVLSNVLVRVVDCAVAVMIVV